MPSRDECVKFIETIAPYTCKYAKQAGIHMAGFVIAQCCEESGYGTSARAKYQHNIVGDIMTGRDYGSWENCIKNYFTWDIVNNQNAKAARTFDEYAKVLFYGNNPNGYVYGEPEAVETLIRPIYNSFGLSKYNDAAGDGGRDLCEEFVTKALSYKGTGSSAWASKHPKWYDAGVWCADFVSGVAEEVGDILGKVFDGSASAYTVAHSVENYNGKYYTDKNYSPQRGDLVNFMWGGGAISGGYADHIGIVTKYENGTVYTIEGNTSDMVAERSYSRSSSVLAAFGHPDWPAGSGSSYGAGFSSLFEEHNTRVDAILREAAYLTVDKYEPTTKQTPIKLSIVNYTDLFESFWYAGQIMSGADYSVEYDFSELDSKVKTCLEFLTGKGLNAGVACGIAANIFYDSQFNAAKSIDNGKKIGICLWSGTRATAMKRQAGSKWSSNYSKQLEYLWYELETSFKKVKEAIEDLDDLEAGARVSAITFSHEFEGYAHDSQQTINRAEKAAQYFDKVIKKVVYNGSAAASGSSFASVDSANVTGTRKERIERARLQYQRTQNGEVYYSWGGVGPNGFDCSGFVSYCLSGQNSRIGTTNTFMGWPTASSPQPGDVCTNWEHCGLYAGDGKMYHCTSWNGFSGVTFGDVQSGMKIVTYGNA